MQTLQNKYAEETTTQCNFLQAGNKLVKCIVCR